MKVRGWGGGGKHSGEPRPIDGPVWTVHREDRAEMLRKGGENLFFPRFVKRMHKAH